MYFIDPPSGWKYGFPKLIPQERMQDPVTWIVEQGYPQQEVDSLGDHFFCRYILADTDEEEINKKTDSIVESVINQIQERSNRGKNKYGTTLDRNDLSVVDWVQHAQEEALDLALYLEKIKKELTKTKTNF